MYIVFYMYVSRSYIVCISDVYCTYLHVYTYFNVFSVRKVARCIDTVIYIQYTCIRWIHIQYTESYTCRYVKIHAIYVHFFWEPVPNHHFSPCTYMNVYVVYSRINDIYTYLENIYVRDRYMHVYVRICMYLHVYCCCHLWPLHHLPSSSYMYVYVCISCICMYMRFMHV